MYNVLINFVISYYNDDIYLSHFSGIIGNGLLDSSDSAPLSATDVSMATLVPLVAATMDRLAVVNATTTISSISTRTFNPESPADYSLLADSSSSSSLPLDATPTPTADWLMSFSTMSALSSVEPTNTNPDPGKRQGHLQVQLRYQGELHFQSVVQIRTHPHCFCFLFCLFFIHSLYIFIYLFCVSKV